MFSVLYVDDEEALLEIGKLFLEQGGQFSVETITAATEALRLLEEREFDAIISDYQMPEMDGIAFLKKVRTSGNTIPFILFTGKGREEVVIDAINSGVDFYLQKGGDPMAQFTELAHKVRQSVQRRRAEADIRNLERRQADIINFLPDPTFAIDTRGIVIAWNRAMEEMTGVHAAEMLGKGDYEYALPGYRARQPVLIDLVLHEDPALEAHYTNLKKNGRTLVAETTSPFLFNGRGATIWITATPLYNTEGDVIGAIQSIRDITEKRHGEAALRESETRFRELSDLLPQIVYEVDTGGNIRYSNRIAFELFGYTEDDFRQGLNIMQMLAPEERERAAAAFRAVVEGTAPTGVPGEYTALRKDGRTFPVSIYSSPVVVDGTTTGLRGIIVDITEGKKGEAAIRESEARLRAIIYSMQMGVVIMDAGTHRILDANDKALELIGARKEEVTGSVCHRFICPAEAGKCPVTDLKETVDCSDRVLLTMQGEKIPILKSVIRTMLEGREVLVESFLDLTESRKAQEELRGAYEQLSAADEELRAQFDELVRSERLIRENEENFQALVESAPDAIYISVGQKFAYVNPAMVRLMGATSADQLIGMSLYDRVHPLFHARVSERARIVTGEHRPAGIEETMYLKMDGTPVHIESAVASFRYNNTFAGLVILRDISRRKEAEDALRQSERRLNAMAANIPGVVYRFSISPGGTYGFDYISSRSTQVLGLENDPNGFFDRVVAGIVQEDRERFISSVRHAVSTKTPWQYDGWFVKPSGKKIWLSAVSNPVIEHGQLVFDGVIFDSSRWKQAEGALQESGEILRKSESRLRRAEEIGKSGNWELRPDENVFEGSAGAQILYGLEGPAWNIGDVQDIPLPEYRPLLDAALKDLVAGRAPYNVEFKIRRKSDRAVLDIHSVAEYDPERNVVFGVINDITDRKKMEESIVAANREYESLLDQMQDVYYRSDAEGILVRASRSFATMLGYADLSECLGRRGESFYFSPAERELFLEEINRNGSVTDYESHLRRKDGSMVVVATRSHLCYDAAGNITGLEGTFRDITRRIQAEEALAESEARYRSTINAFTDAVSVVDREFRVILANASLLAWLRALGQDDTITGKQIMDAFPFLPPAVIEEYRTVFSTGTTLVTEESSHIGTAEIITETRKIPLTEHGKVVAVVAIIRDITERRQAELALAESEAKYRRIVETTRDIIYTLNPAGEFSFVSPSVIRVLGYTPEELSGRPLLSLIHPDDVPTVRENFRRSMAEDYQSPGTESRICHASGEWHWLITRGEVVRDAFGNALYFAGIANDITGRKRAEEELKKSEEKFRYLVEYGLEAIMVTDMQGTVLLANNAVSRLVEYDDYAGLVGKNVMEFIAPESRGDVFRDFAEVARGHDSYLAEYKVISAKGRKISVESIGKVVSYEGRPADLISLRDITGRKRTEEALRLVNRKLSLLSGITRHDITNQLTVLKGHLAFLEKRQPDTTYSTSFGKINDAANRILSMIRFTKEYEAIGVHAPGWQNCHRLADAAAKHAAPGRISVKNDLPATLEVFADPLIATVFYNILENAVRYGGKITTIRFSAEGPEGHPVIICEDDGDGIPAAEKEKIFERGFGKNTGLGLFLAREILSITEITIRETGVPGTGARFEISVPEGGSRERGEKKE
jgi:PAS domain S-box-containing protein